MIRLRFMILFAYLLCLVAVAAVVTAEGEKQGPSQENKADEIVWLRYDEGLKKAQQENKHVFIDFTTSWCGWCKKMDKETFSRPDVIELLNDYFVTVMVDGDSKRELDIDGYKITEKNLTRQEFRVSGFPAFWFLKPDGSKLALIKGYRPAEYMIEALNFVKDRKYDSTSTESPEEKEK
jgi:thioredoxin-related protein